MSLTISDLILDEEFRTTQSGAADDNDVSPETFIASSVDEAVAALSLTTLAGFTGFPQHAVKTNFVSSSNPVTDYFLGDSSGNALNGVATDLYVGGNQVFLYSTSDPNIVVGRVGNGTTADSDGDVALLVCVEETKDTDGFVTSANLWSCIFAPLVEGGENLVDSADQLDLTDLIYLGSDFDTTTEVPFKDFSDVPSGNNLFNVIFPTGATPPDVQLLLTGSEGETLGTVNVSTQGIGANSQHVDTDATLRIDIVKGMTQASVDDPPEVNQSGNIDYTGRVNLVAANFEITQTNANGKPADLVISAFLAGGTSQEAGYLTNAIASDGTPVVIDAADVRILDADGNDITAAWQARAGTNIVQDGNGVKITGLLEGDRVAFTTDGENFNRMLITNVDSKETFDVGNINVTAIEGGSDTEFAELGSHLIFQDDGPLIALSGDPAPDLEVDETDLATDDSADFSGLFDPADFGADGEGSISYELGIKLDGTDAPNCGLTDTGSGNAVFLFLESGKVVGREGTSAADATSGDIVFELSVDADGNVTLDQKRAVVHVDANDHNASTGISAADLITLTATAFDSEAADENDSASATANIADSLAFFDDGPDITPQPMGSATPNDLLVANTIGATDSSSYGLDGGADGQGSFAFLIPDSSGDFQWGFHDWDGDGTAESHEIKGTHKGADLYKMILNPDGTYTFEMRGTLPGSTLDLNVNEIKAGGPDTNSIEVGALQNSQFVRITGDSGVGAGNINESHAFVGVDNGNLDASETLIFTLHNANGSAVNFLGMSIGTKSAQASNYHVVANLVGGDTWEADVPVDKNGVLMIDPPGNVFCTSIEVTKLDGSATKIGLGDIDIFVPANDVVLEFDTRLTDGDDDFAGASFTVSIDGNNDGSITNPVSASLLSAGLMETLKVRESLDMSMSSIDHQQHDFLLL